MQQAVGVSSNLDLVDVCVRAETTNFELFQEVARLNQEAARQQEAVCLLERQTGKLRSVTGSTPMTALLRSSLQSLYSEAVQASKQQVGLSLGKHTNDTCLQ